MPFTPDVLYLAGHGNGVDCSSGGFVFCARNDFDKANLTSEDGVLPCFVDGTCEVCTSSTLEQIDVSKLRGRRILNLTCWGMVAHPYLYDRRISIGWNLLQNNTGISYITTVRAAFLRQQDLLLAYYLINSGIPMGLVAQSLNKSRIAAGLDADFLCFGSPANELPRTVVDSSAASMDETRTLTVNLDTRDYCVRQLASDESITGVAKATVAGPVANWDGSIYFTASEPLQIGEVDPEAQSSIERCRKDVVSLLDDASTVSQQVSRLRVAAYTLPEDEAMEKLIRKIASFQNCAANFLSYIDSIHLVYSANILQPLLGDLQTQLSQCSIGLFDLFKAMALRIGGRAPLWILTDLNKQLVSSICEGTCDGCGNNIDVQIRAVPCSLSRRKIEFCRSCGFLSDSEDLNETAGQMQSTAGGAIQFRKHIKNTLHLDIPVSSWVHMYSGEDRQLIESEKYAVLSGECSCEIAHVVANASMTSNEIRLLHSLSVVGLRFKVERQQLSEHSLWLP